MRAALIAVVASCASPAARSAQPDYEPLIEQALDPPPPAERAYAIWLGGARVGTAIETERWSRHGVALRRVETMRFLRGDAPVAMTTTIDVDADAALVPARVSWSERTTATRTATAIRTATGWTIDSPQRSALLRAPPEPGLAIDGAPALPADAVPAELVALLARRDGRFEGRVFLPARGFVTGRGRIEPVAPDRLVARLAFDTGAVAEATIDFDRDGYTRVVDGDGVIAIRTTRDRALAPFPLVDLIGATAIPIGGTRTRTSRLALEDADGVELAPSQPLPDALAAAPDRTAEIRALVGQVRRRISPDLAASPASAATATTAKAGDCTTYALAYAAQARARSIPTRVVTGLRVDGNRLIRHRWAVSWTGRAWISVDAAFAAAPAGGDLVGLAIHDADDAGLVAGEAALVQVRAAAWR